MNQEEVEKQWDLTVPQKAPWRQKQWRGRDGWLYHRGHIPDKAEYETKWRIYDIDRDELFEADLSSSVEERILNILRRTDREAHRSRVDEWTESYMEYITLERLVFMLTYPTVPVISRNGFIFSASEIPYSAFRFVGLKMAILIAMTIAYPRKHHAEALPQLVLVHYVISVPTYEGFTFYEGQGRELMRVMSGDEYIICEGEQNSSPCDVPDTVREQVRAHYYSQTRKVRFAVAEQYDSHMAAYFAQKWGRHADQLKALLAQIPENRRCVFPADGIGLGARLRPGSISGDRVRHWLSHEDVQTEEIITTLQRAAPTDVIIVMYAAVFFGPEEKTQLSSMPNPVIFVDSHYYPMPIRHAQIIDQHTWAYRSPPVKGTLPTDQITIEDTPLFSDKLLFLNETVEVCEWTKTVAWYAISQQGRVCSSIDWMRDFLNALKLNVVKGPGIPAVMTLEAGARYERFFFIPTGQITPEPIDIEPRVECVLEVGTVYRAPDTFVKAFKCSEGDCVWSSFSDEYEWRDTTDTIHRTIAIKFAPPDVGRITQRTELCMTISFESRVGVFHRDSPHQFKTSASHLYPRGVPTSFIKVFVEWYGGLPASLFQKKKQKKRRR